MHTNYGRLINDQFKLEHLAESSQSDFRHGRAPENSYQLQKREQEGTIPCC